MSIGFTNTTNSTHCGVPPPVYNPFKITLGSSSSPAHVIESVEENTSKPVFKITTEGIRTLPYQPFFNAYQMVVLRMNEAAVGQLHVLVPDLVFPNI